MYKNLVNEEYLYKMSIPSMEFKKESFTATDILAVYNDDTYTFRNKAVIACREKGSGKLYVDMQVMQAPWKQVVFGEVWDYIVFVEGSMVTFLANNKTGLAGYIKRYMPNGSVDKWKGALV